MYTHPLTRTEREFANAGDHASMLYVLLFWVLTFFWLFPTKMSAQLTLGQRKKNRRENVTLEDVCYLLQFAGTLGVLRRGKSERDGDRNFCSG